jgi:hypothetical protein
MEAGWEKVRARAHAIWEHEGRPEAGAERHWRQAEEELRAEGDGRAEAPATEAATAAAEAEGATSPEGGAEKPRAGDQKRARSPAAETARTGG